MWQRVIANFSLLTLCSEDLPSLFFPLNTFGLLDLFLVMTPCRSCIFREGSDIGCINSCEYFVNVWLYKCALPASDQVLNWLSDPCLIRDVIFTSSWLAVGANLSCFPCSIFRPPLTLWRSVSHTRETLTHPSTSPGTLGCALRSSDRQWVESRVTVLLFLLFHSSCHRNPNR